MAPQVIAEEEIPGRATAGTSGAEATSRWIAALDVAFAIILGVLLIALPMAMGAVAPWARSVLFCGALALAVIWLTQCLVNGRIRLVRGWFWAPVAAFLALAVVQLLPMPASALQALSPAAAKTRQVVSPDATGPFTLSLFPYATRVNLIRVVALVLVLFCIVHCVRKPWQVVAILGVLTAVGLFEALYGFGEQFSGSKRIFWVERRFYLTAVTGTFWNKNHFAGFLEMVLPATLGLLFGTLPRLRGPGGVRARMAHAISSSRTYLPLFLSIAAILMALGICFSLSRAGILCATASLAGFAVCLGLSAGFRRYTLLLFALLAGICLVAVIIGAEVVGERLEDVASGRSASWADRLDLSLSGVRLVRQFFWFGAGLGSFRYVFERFQSARFGDLVADYLHNDWLQLVCEAGIIGWALALAALALLVWRIASSAFGRRDAFCRWTALGALIGACAMMLHSLFDFNLSKVTSNAFVFAVLLGVAFAAAHMPSGHSGSRERRRYLEIPISGRVSRLLLGAAALALAALVCVWPVRLALADVAFNRFLVASGVKEPDPHFFLPLDEPRDEARAHNALVLAREMDPGNPQLYYWGAIFKARQAQDIALRKARDASLELLGQEVARLDPGAVDKVAAALAADPSFRSSPQQLTLLAEAQDDARAALELLPIAAENHILMAQILLALPNGDGESSTSPSVPALHARRALWLAPNKPWVLCAAGKALYEEASSLPPGPRKKKALEAVHELLRRAMAVDPSYSDEVYNIVRAGTKDPAALMAVTPKTPRAYERLAGALWALAEWDALLACLEELEAICDQQLTPEELSPWLLRHHPSATGPSDLAAEAGLAPTYNLRSLFERKLAACRKRVLVLGMLGRWSERAKALEHCRTLTRAGNAENMKEIRRRIAELQYDRAGELLQKVLDNDWADPEALLLAAEVANMASAVGQPPPAGSALDHLFRLVIYNDTLSPEHVARARTLLNQAPRNSEAERLVREFILGAAEVLGDEPSQGVLRLERLAAREDETVLSWRQRHLIWYYLALGLERMGHTEASIQALRRVVEIVPTHFKARMRLAALVPEVHGDLSDITPAVPCGVSLGGRVTFLGYDLSLQELVSTRQGVQTQERRWVIKYYWMAEERMPRGSLALVRFCDSERRVIFANDHALQSKQERYPVDFPRCHEVFTESHVLGGDPASVSLSAIGIRMPGSAALGTAQVSLTDGAGLTQVFMPLLIPNEEKIASAAAP